MRCPVDEIGRNSVKPSTTPRMMQQRHGRCFSLEPCFVSVAKSHMRQALKAFSNAKVLAEVHEGGRQQHPRIISVEPLSEDAQTPKAENTFMIYWSPLTGRSCRTRR